eukprot:3622206-Prymnesium_polylepis.1
MKAEDTSMPMVPGEQRSAGREQQRTNAPFHGAVPSAAFLPSLPPGGGTAGSGASAMADADHSDARARGGD